MKLINNLEEFTSFEDFRYSFIKRILEREPGITPNLLERVNPESYIDNPIDEIPLDKIDNIPDSALAIKHGLEQFAKDGYEPDKGAFHGVRLGKQVDIPIAVKANDDGTFSIVDGVHRAIQIFINGDKTILAFVKGGLGKTLKEIFYSKNSEFLIEKI